MRDVNPFVGVSVCAAVAMMSLNEAFEAVIRHPNGIGLALALSIAVVAVAACRSIYRDRIG